MSPTVTVTKKLQQNSESRHISERSVMSTVDFLLIIASTHLIIDEPD